MFHNPNFLLLKEWTTKFTSLQKRFMGYVKHKGHEIGKKFTSLINPFKELISFFGL